MAAVLVSSTRYLKECALALRYKDQTFPLYVILMRSKGQIFKHFKDKHPSDTNNKQSF